jgi:hypothetical protein
MFDLVFLAWTIHARWTVGGKCGVRKGANQLAFLNLLAEQASLYDGADLL